MNAIDKNVIMKQNSLILAKWQEELNSIDLRILNVLINVLQNELLVDMENVNLYNYKKIIKRKVFIKAAEFKKKAFLGNNANIEIWNSLKKIRDTSTILKNFTDIDGTKYKQKTVSLLDDVGILNKDNKMYEHDQREEVYVIVFNEWFLKTSSVEFNRKVGNFTNLPIAITNSFNGKHPQKLYELLKSKQYRDTSFSMSLKELISYFELKETVSLSHVLAILKRIENKVNKNINFKYEVFKKDKMISFIFL